MKKSFLLLFLHRHFFELIRNAKKKKSFSFASVLDSYRCIGACMYIIHCFFVKIIYVPCNF